MSHTYITNPDSLNPKKNKLRRRIRHFFDGIAHIPHFHLVPRLDGRGRPIEGKFRVFWGGRKPGKYMPHVGQKQLRKAANAL